MNNEKDAGGLSALTEVLGCWIPCADGLPDIPDGETCSGDVLAGCWITDDWLRDDHPDKRRFIFGACRVMRETDLREFPHGKRWHTFGPSHNQITHWTSITPPNCYLLDNCPNERRMDRILDNCPVNSKNA